MIDDDDPMPDEDDPTPMDPTMELILETCGITPELRASIEHMSQEQLAAFTVLCMRRIGLPWSKVARVLNRTVAQAKQLELDYPWPFPETPEASD